MRNSIILLFTVLQFSTAYTQGDSIINRLFLDSNVDFVFKTSIDIRENHLSGIVYMKRIGSDTIRVLMTGEMGNTLFDLTVYSKGYLLNSCLSQMKKKRLLKRLAFYFRAMTYPVQVSTREKTRLNTHFIDYTLVEERITKICVFKKIQHPILTINFHNGLDSITLKDNKWNVTVELIKITKS